MSTAKVKKGKGKGTAKAAPKKQTTFKGCTFAAVHMDEHAMCVLEDLVDTLNSTAQACDKIARLFDTSQVRIRTLLHVGKGSVHLEDCIFKPTRYAED